MNFEEWSIEWRILPLATSSSSPSSAWSAFLTNFSIWYLSLPSKGPIFSKTILNLTKVCTISEPSLFELNDFEFNFNENIANKWCRYESSRWFFKESREIPCG